MNTTLAKNLTVDDRKIIKILTRQLARQFGPRLKSIILFGSRARGDARPDSDIDLAVILDQDDPESRETIRDLAAELGLEYGLFVSTRIWSQKHWNFLQALQTSLYQNIQKDGIELLPKGMLSA